MFKKIVIGAVFLLSLSPMFFPLLTSADGMLIAPPDRYVFESGQKGVIFFENGEERLILATAFRGDTNDFAWIIPSPSKPEVSKASAEIFSSLQSLTGTQLEMPTAGGIDFGIGAASKQGVQIIEQKSIEYYDLAVLSSDDKAALTNWLNTNGYHFPEQYSYILQSYIDNNWFFTAVKFKNDVNAQVLATGMKSGNLIPLEFKFKTDKPVFPLKISSVIEEPTLKTTPNYVNGLDGQAVEISSKDKISLLNHSYDIRKGSIEMWIKVAPSYKSTSPSIGFFSTNKTNDGYKSFVFGASGGALYSRVDGTDVSPTYQYWNAGNKINLGDNWNYIVMTWQEGEVPKFYLNGNLVPAYSDSVPFPKINDDFSRNLYIGGSPMSFDYDTIYVDQIRLSSNVRSAGEVTDNYNNGLGKTLSSDENTILASSFNGNIKYTNNNRNENSFIYTTTANVKPQNFYSYKPSSVGIELYVFTPDKEQTLPGFQTTYAAWTDKKTIQNLALDDNGKPWLEVKKDKYYLTKLTRTMRYEEMTNDLFFRDAATNSDVDTGPKSKVSLYIILGLGGLISLIIIVIIILKINRD